MTKERKGGKRAGRDTEGLAGGLEAGQEMTSGILQPINLSANYSSKPYKETLA